MKHRKENDVFYTCRSCGTTTHSEMGTKRLEKQICVTCFVTSPYYTPPDIATFNLNGE